MNAFRMHILMVVVAMASLIAAGATGHAANMNAFSFQDMQHSAAPVAGHAAHDTKSQDRTDDTKFAAQHDHTDAADCGGDMCVSVFVLPLAPEFNASRLELVNARLAFLDLALESAEVSTLQRPPNT